MIDLSAVMREDLASVVPLIETGQGSTVETVVSVVNVLVKGGVILYGFSVVS